MLGNIDIPESLSKERLDDLLLHGWFRTGQTVFTCNFLRFNDVFYSAIWLRISLAEANLKQRLAKYSKHNQQFTIKIRPATIDDEKEQLYGLYKTGITFDTANSLTELLLRPEQENIFDTYEVCLYDDDRLIGCGFFDLGAISAAGIVSFYHPDYKKNSLGKYLILLKINYCQLLGLSYFYPGYFAPNYILFDYKLSLYAPGTSFYNMATAAWQPIHQFEKSHVLIDVLKDKLHNATVSLALQNIRLRNYSYEYYNINYIPSFKGMDMFDYPYFAFVYGSGFKDCTPILVFDVKDNNYKIVNCVGYPCNLDTLPNISSYNSHLLKLTEVFFKSAHLSEVVGFLMEKCANPSGSNC